MSVTRPPQDTPMNAHPRLGPRLRVLAAAALLACAGPVPAQGQDAAKAINLFQSLMRPAPPAQAPQPATPPAANPAGALTQLLGGAGAPAANAQANRATDLVRLLSQSLEQVDEPREIEIGRQLSAVLLGSKPLHPDLRLQRYVNQLGRWVSLQSARPELPWTFAVLDDPGFNAFAAPGGYVFVTRGLVERVADEAELAGILAHEITHVTEKHHLQALRKNARAGLLTQAVGAQISGGAVGDALSAQLIALGRDVYARGLDQDDEFAADRAGVALAARAGFDPYGLVAVLQQLRTATPDNPLFALTLSTHPPAQLRLDQLEQAMGNRLDAFSGKPGVTVAQRLAPPATPVAPAQATPAAPRTAAPVRKKS
jgi:predicted Zn-dependent protease